MYKFEFCLIILTATNLSTPRKKVLNVPILQRKDMSILLRCKVTIIFQHTQHSTAFFIFCLIFLHLRLSFGSRCSVLHRQDRAFLGNSQDSRSTEPQWHILLHMPCGKIEQHRERIVIYRLANRLHHGATHSGVVLAIGKLPDN